MPHNVQSASRDRALSLAGAAAARWLRHRSWNVDTSRHTKARLYADEIALGGSRIRRSWHTAAQLAHVPSVAAGHLLMLQHEGEATITTADRTDTLVPGSILVVERSTPFALHAGTSVARMEITLRAGRGGLSTPLPGAVWVSAPGHPTRSILLSAVNAALNSDLRPHTPAFTSTMSAISELAVAVIAEAFPEPSFHATRREAALFASALALIRDGAGDPGMTVARIADELNTSVRHLQRVFAAHGSTPAASLRTERRRRAEAVADHGARREHLDAIANSVGYTSHRAMRRALRAPSLDDDGSASTAARMRLHTC